MYDKDKELYDYIINNSANISSQWFGERTHIKGSIYSKDADLSIEQKLKEQHKYTIDLIASGFLDDRSIFQDKMKEWTKFVVTSRIEYDTPIFEVLQALSRTRRIIWGFVEDYIKGTEEIDKQDVLRWNSIYNTTLDTLINEFSRSYYNATTHKLKVQQELIDEINSPVIPVVDDVAVLPLIGLIDESRAESILQSIPDKCVRKNIAHLVIDVSGANYLDTSVAHRLYQLINVISLLGINSIIAGVRPDVAQTAIKLGIDFSHLKTFSDLKQALRHFGVRR
ncbi:STAS domain-containing protein [Peribacillus saganii]|uniref:STAS domain-containing protein n=1 Tax=Peribacillus saganii TaxID=2303992 RepID=A0A372LNP4_9BACI|nr:STAS domain-containing protein [Peribacillus saganii]RFU68981.1 STAS domain-containing protein [Peribacillus saganii]